MMAHSAAILGQQIAALQRANTVATERKSRKRRRIQSGGVIASENLIDQDLQSDTGRNRAILR
jgi:hypothetical protein